MKTYDQRARTLHDGLRAGCYGYHGGAYRAKPCRLFPPHLKLGMTLLDCGCGPGTITLGLAELVAPGEVVNTEIEESHVVGVSLALPLFLFFRERKQIADRRA